MGFKNSGNQVELLFERAGIGSKHSLWVTTLEGLENNISGKPIFSPQNSPKALSFEIEECHGGE